ncbi:50S ribosomal protein L3 [Hahella sp. CCB-MM4]|uniref:50S ribosomal protein L3 n=1 Tax=Hahella sp. (strain CCB-MM4) TaxID=1926491 RepID=UPI000B9C4A55|nr:50S ribosomal protein L3 [Hahella sp. CCB-MM4]OZG70911.1 50S ribosomal protein L3 [Hahella sp. CCB-MM4]
MAIGLVGRKAGMTRVFQDDGTAVPVTVIQVEKNVISQVKTVEVDGYRAIQVAAGAVKASHVNKPMAGHYAKAGVEAGRVVTEFRLDENDSNEYKAGDEVSLSIFEAGQKVDVSGRSKGKGFAGVVKRWNFATQDATHGNSLSHRAPGSIGQNQSPGRVFKGKKMAGQMGNKNVTVQTLQLVRIDQERGLLLVKGAIPGATGADVIVKPAVKA